LPSILDIPSNPDFVPDFDVAPGFEFLVNIEFPPYLDFQPGFDLSLNFGALNTAGSSFTLPTPAATLQTSGSWTDSLFLPDEDAEYDNFAVEGQEPEDDDEYIILWQIPPFCKEH
jgi:hypothetical protein